ARRGTCAGRSHAHRHDPASGSGRGAARRHGELLMPRGLPLLAAAAIAACNVPESTFTPLPDPDVCLSLNAMPYTLPVGHSAPAALAVADVSGDGRLDLIVANSATDTVSVLLGRSDGTFQTRLEYPTGAQPSAVAVADVNRDGKPDIVVANLAADTVSVLL